VFITYYLLPTHSLPTCFYRCRDHHQVTYKNIWNLNSLSKCMSEPFDVTENVSDFLYIHWNVS